MSGLETDRLPVAILPLVLAMGLGAYQLLPPAGASNANAVQESIQAAVSESNDLQTRTDLMKTALLNSLKTGRSISPATTRFEMSRLLVVAGAFLVATQLFARPSTQVYLWLALAINGAALTFVGFAQQLSWNGKILWMIPTKYKDIVFATFINRNNAAGYLCICLACALGFAIWSFSDLIERARDLERISAGRTKVRHSSRLPMLGFISQIGHLSAAQLISVALVVLNATGIVLAASRGGWLAMGLATVATLIASLAMFNSRALNSRGLHFLAVIGLCCVGLVFWTNQEHRLGQRWQQTSVDAIAADSRWDHWSDVIHAARDFPVFGTGFGTYQFANLPYQTHEKWSHLRFFNADNLFLEWLIEGGAIGLGLVVLVLVFSSLAVVALWQRSRRGILEPAATVGVFLIVSQCASSFFDFGPTMPGNMLAIATVFGAIAGRAALLVNRKQIEHGGWMFALPPITPRLFIPALGVVLLVAEYHGVREVQAAANARVVSQHLPDLNSPNLVHESAVTDQIKQLSLAMENYADDSESHKALADLYLFRFRLQEFSLAKDRFPDIDASLLWEQTNPIFLLRQIHLWESEGQLERIESLLAEPTIQENLAPAYTHLQQAQAACQLMPGADQLLAMLDFLVPPDDRRFEIHLQRALVMAPANPEAYYVVGQLSLAGGLFDFAYSSFKKSLELNSRFLQPIHQTVRDYLTLEEEMDYVFPPSGERLVQLALEFPLQRDTEQRHEIARRAIELLSQDIAGDQEAKRRRTLGKAKQLLGETDEAIEEYRRALELSPRQTEWRIELIHILQVSKGNRWALREAEIAAALAPEHKTIQAMVRELQIKVESKETTPTTTVKPRQR